MSAFEHSLATALRREVEELAMNVDMHEAAVAIDTRLDAADRDRRRRTWIGGIAAAAVAVLAIGAAVAWSQGDHHAAPANPEPSSSASYTSAFFVDPFTATLPAWVVDGGTRKVSRSDSYQYWDHCAADATCANLSVTWVSGVAQAGSTVTVDARALVDHLTALGSAGKIVITSRTSTTVDGRPATDLRVRTTTDLPGELACGPLVCQDINGRSLARYVVVDMGPNAAPVLVWADAPLANPHGDEWLGQLDTLLRTMRFTGIGPIEGRWTGTLTAEQARAAVAAAGLPAQDAAALGDPVRLIVVFASGNALVSVVDQHGAVVRPLANLPYRTSGGHVTLGDGQQLTVSGGPSSARFTAASAPTSSPSPRAGLAAALLVATTWAR